ncbi:MAG: hypothetical protein ACI861_002526 [Paracoccaceae bacterium]|jgi:hypothetical protein
MEYVGVIVAAVASYAFGAAWYMILGKQWMEAAGISAEDVNKKNPTPFIISFVMTLLVAGMMRHAFEQAGITTASEGLPADAGSII